MKNLNKLALFLALGAGIAIAQSTPQGSQSTPSSPSTAPSSQAPDQSAQPSTDQSKPANPPEQMPKTDQSTTPSSDQNKSSDQSAKLPQSDASGSAGGDVAGQVQSALQQDPKLSGANITAKVNGKDLELNGTVQSADEKKQAEKIAKSNAGSMKVKNHIKVASSSTGATDKDKGSNPPKY